MVRLTWLVTVLALGGLFYGLRTGYLEPMGNYYLALVVATALLTGLSVGFLAALAAARLPGPTWLALIAALAGCAAAVTLLVRGAMALLPPIYYVADIARWSDVPAWRVMTVFAPPAALLACLPGFGLWRWWNR